LINHNDLENSDFSVKQHMALMFFKNISIFLITLAWVRKHLELAPRHPLYFFRNVECHLEVLQQPWKFGFSSKKALGIKYF